jgi:hypothetical protein
MQSVSELVPVYPLHSHLCTAAVRTSNLISHFLTTFQTIKFASKILFH